MVVAGRRLDRSRDVLAWPVSGLGDRDGVALGPGRGAADGLAVGGGEGGGEVVAVVGVLLLKDGLGVVGHAGGEKDGVHLFGEIGHGRRSDDDDAFAFHLIVHSVVAVPKFSSNHLIPHRKAERPLHHRLLHLHWNLEREPVKRRPRDRLLILGSDLCLSLPVVGRVTNRDALVEGNVVDQNLALQLCLVL